MTWNLLDSMNLPKDIRGKASSPLTTAEGLAPLTCGPDRTRVHMLSGTSPSEEARPDMRILKVMCVVCMS